MFSCKKGNITLQFGCKPKHGTASQSSTRQRKSHKSVGLRGMPCRSHFLFRSKICSPAKATAAEPKRNKQLQAWKNSPASRANAMKLPTKNRRANLWQNRIEKASR